MKAGVIMMKSKSLIALLLVSGVVLNVNAKPMNSKAVYAKMCSLCHGKTGEGNANVPDAPALNTLSKADLVAKLSDIKGKGFDNAHEKMENNQKIIELRGMKYNVQDMAEYIYGNFNKEK